MSLIDKKNSILIIISIFLVLLVAYRGGGEEVKKVEHKEDLTIIACYEPGPKRKTLNEIIESYKTQHPHVKVQVEYLSPNTYRKELAIRMEQGKLSDIIICENVIVPALIDMGILQDIDTYIEEKEIFNHYTMGLWGNARSDGKLYSIPLSYDPYVMYYNKDHLKTKGQDVPKDWSSLLEVCETISNRTFGTHAIGVALRQTEEATNIFIQLLASTGGSIRSLNDENGIKVFRLFEELSKKQWISKECINWNEIDLIEVFINGEVSMMFNRLSALKTLQEREIGFNFGVSIIPYDKKEAYLYHGENMAITVQADYEEAIKFIDYLVQDKVTKKFAQETGTISINIDDETLNESEGTLKELIQNHIKQGISKGSFNLWFNISDAISQGIRNVLKNEKQVQEIADEVQDKVSVAIIEN